MIEGGRVIDCEPVSSLPFPPPSLGVPPHNIEVIRQWSGPLGPRAGVGLGRWSVVTCTIQCPGSSLRDLRPGDRRCPCPDTLHGVWSGDARNSLPWMPMFRCPACCRSPRGASDVPVPRVGRRIQYSYFVITRLLSHQLWLVGTEYSIDARRDTGPRWSGCPFGVRSRPIVVRGGRVSQCYPSNVGDH